MIMTNKALSLAFIALVSASMACSSGSDDPHAEVDQVGIQNYAKQSMSILKAVSTERNELIKTLKQSVSAGENNKIQYDQSKALPAIERMRAQLDRSRKEFEATAIPKGALTFPDGVKRYFDAEQTFLDDVSKFFTSDGDEGDRNKWIALMQKPQLLSYQSAQLYRTALTASGEPHNANSIAQ